MSWDIVFFDPEFAPRDGKAFRDWMEKIMEADWPQVDHDLLPPTMKAWLDMMTKRFPDMEIEPDHPDAIDYSFVGPRGEVTLLYLSQGQGSRELAMSMGQETAKKVGLGTYDVMSDDGSRGRHIVFPDGPVADIPKPPSFFSKLFGKAKD